MTYLELQEREKVKREALTVKLKEAGIYPVTQHPDYSNGPAYDIDDIVEFLETLETLKDKK